MTNHLQPAALDKPTLPEGSYGYAISRIARAKHALIPQFLNTLRSSRGRGGAGGLRRIFASIYLLTATIATAQIHAPQINKKEKSAPENIEWIWQYTPDDSNKDGRENDLVQDPHFRPFLDQFFTAPQTFWGTPIDGKPRTLPTTVLDHLSVPDKVIADDNRYVSITGCVVHFCPARGLLWIDLNGSHHLVVFAAIDWIKDGQPTSNPAAEYTLWVFPNQPLSIAEGAHPPPALTKSIARWAAQPLAGSGIVQNITHAILVDPDGTPHEVLPSALGIASPSSKPDTDSAPVLKPRN
jgi:hypothetical protein